VKNKAFLWLQALVLKWGGVGMFAVTFVDSSSVAFPFFPDAVVMQLCVANPARMPYYVAMASLGSLAGAMVLFALAKKGGEAYFHRHARGKGEKIKEWVEHNAFLSAFVPAILPPPFPFKPFVVAEGVFQVPWKTFIAAVLLGRAVRYGLEGTFAVKYGDRALGFMKVHGAVFVLSVLGLTVALYFVMRYAFHGTSASGSADAGGSGDAKK
jgi:membrane protein YqaA with SNARE-associated domain